MRFVDTRWAWRPACLMVAAMTLGSVASVASSASDAASATSAAPASPVAPVPQAADLFDFWLGDWTVTWTNANGSLGKAHNRITRSLDGQVIEEQFEEDAADPPPLLRGHSISVLHRASGQWKQAWADNQGGFFAFTAQVDGERRIFATELRAEGGQVKGQRMVFRDITRDAFVWDWEGTTDGGAHWKLLWQLQYRR